MAGIPAAPSGYVVFFYWYSGVMLSGKASFRQHSTCVSGRLQERVTGKIPFVTGCLEVYRYLFGAYLSKMFH